MKITKIITKTMKKRLKVTKILQNSSRIEKIRPKFSKIGRKIVKTAQKHVKIAKKSLKWTFYGDFNIY